MYNSPKSGRGVTEITYLANMMYSEGRFPEKMYKCIFITIPNVKGTAKCEKHRTLSLMSHVTTLVLRVIMNRIRGRTLYSTVSCLIEVQISRKNDREAKICICLFHLLQQSV